jgi:PKD repeat protein
VGLVFIVRSCISGREIQATVSPADIESGLPVQYADSTKGANTWLWEFGNGDTSSEPSGMYVYKELGKYQIRLTVDGKLEKKFIINIRPNQKENNSEQLIQIIAPATGLQGEYIIFRGEGSSKEWRWEFGETGVVDAREKTAIYQYTDPGMYEVLLTTEETQYPIRHTIKIEGQYTDNDTTDIESMIGYAIREKLQAIVDQKSFNKNYNDILTNYLCNKNPNTLVVVNNTKKNDFYSYCQGLRIIGRKKVTIEKVLIEMDDENDYCINKLIVIQTDTE